MEGKREGYEGKKVIREESLRKRGGRLEIKGKGKDIRVETKLTK